MLLPPAPVSPVDGDTVITGLPTLKVGGSPALKRYHFRVMEEASVAAEGYSLTPAWDVGSSGRALQRGHAYHWSCRAWDGAQWSPWFAPDWRFTVGSALEVPRPKLPSDGAVERNRKPLLFVAQVPHAAYRFQLWNGKSMVGEGVSAQPSWCCPVILETGVGYSWTCRAESDVDTSAWFAPMWHFTVADPTTNEAAKLMRLPGPVGATTADPNPFSSRVRVVPARDLGPVTRLAVYSAEGRLVRELDGLSWDGRDEAGGEAGPGTYVIFAAGTQRHEFLRIVKVR